MQQQRNAGTVSQMMAQIRDLQNRVNSFSDAREFYDPESRSSSGATHVPDQTSTILSSRTLPRCDSGLPRNTQNCTGIMGNVFERLLVQEGLPSTIFHNSKNLAFSSQDLRHDISETARREREMKRESLNTSTQSPHFRSRSGMLNHTGGKYSHGGMMDYPRIPVTEWNLGKFLDSMEFQSWKINFRTEVCLRTADPQVTMLWIKEVAIAKSIDELVKSRSITGQPNFLDFDMLDAMIASGLKKLLNTQSNFWKRASVEEQRAQDFRPLLTRKTNCIHDLRVFPCNRIFWSSTRTRRFVHYEFAEWRPRFRCKMGSCTLTRERNAFRRDPGRITHKSKLQNSVQFQTVMALYDQEVARNNGTPNYQQLKTAVKLHNDQMMRNRNISESAAMLWNEDQLPRVKKERKLALRAKWESVFSGRHMDNVPKETHVVSVMTF